MRHNWRKPTTWPLTRKVFVLMLAATYLPLGYVLYGWGPSHAAPQPAVQPTVVNYYETPCQNQARVSRGIPPLTVDQSQGLIAWERNHAGTDEAASYHAALDACGPAAKFNWGGMVLAHQETVG